MVLRTSLAAMPRYLNNNTPVNTEVLWGGGLWWGTTRGKDLWRFLCWVPGGGPCHHHDGGANGTGNRVPCVDQVAEVAVDRRIPRATVVSTVGV